jgi:hypothetical protein
MKTVSKKPPAMHYKAWTPLEVRTMKKLARQKLGVAKIAKELKRTTWSVRNRAGKEGISISARG